MFDHVEFSVSDISAARRFYGPIFDAIGADEAFFDQASGELGIEMQGVVQFLISQSKATEPKLHLCFRALDKESVEKAYAGAIAGGGVCNGPPGYRNNFSAGYFAAFVYDPDGHNIEILFRDPTQTA